MEDYNEKGESDYFKRLWMYNLITSPLVFQTKENIYDATTNIDVPLYVLY